MNRPTAAVFALLGLLLPVASSAAPATDPRTQERVMDFPAEVVSTSREAPNGAVVETRICPARPLLVEERRDFDDRTIDSAGNL